MSAEDSTNIGLTVTIWPADGEDGDDDNGTIKDDITGCTITDSLCEAVDDSTGFTDICTDDEFMNADFVGAKIDIDGMITFVVSTLW